MKENAEQKKEKRNHLVTYFIQSLLILGVVKGTLHLSGDIDEISTLL